VVDRSGRPWLTDFSFSALAATQRQMALGVAELLASLAAIVGADRAVASAAAVILAVVGLLLATRQGRRFASGRLIPGLRSAAVVSGRWLRAPAR
jgi:hypothetical protein